MAAAKLHEDDVVEVSAEADGWRSEAGRQQCRAALEYHNSFARDLLQSSDLQLASVGTVRSDRSNYCCDPCGAVRRAINP